MPSIDVSIEKLDCGDRSVFFRPPLNRLQRDMIEEVVAPVVTFMTNLDEDSGYTEMWIHADTSITSEYADRLSRQIAHTAAGVLSQSGEDVRFDRQVHPAGWGRMMLTGVDVPQ